jgi:hypothetical protein
MSASRACVRVSKKKKNVRKFVKRIRARTITEAESVDFIFRSLSSSAIASSSSSKSERV